MRSLKELEKTSPYPVHLNWDNWSDEVGGSFNWNLERIRISSAGTPAEKFAVLSHEIGHANCHKKDCCCSKKHDDWQGEYHAMKAGLLGCAGYKKALKFTVDTIRECAAGEIGERWHQRAARKIVKTKFYAKACLASI